MPPGSKPWLRHWGALVHLYPPPCGRPNQWQDNMNTEHSCNTGYRMNNFVVGLTNNTPNLMPPTIHGYVECGRWKGAAPAGQTLFVKCAAGQAPARYVVIVTQQTYMNFCELEVYGNGLYSCVVLDIQCRIEYFHC
jgi:hypothetical protein